MYFQILRNEVLRIFSKAVRGMALVSLLAALTISATAQSSGSGLRDRINDIKVKASEIEASSVPKALRSLSTTYHIPLGLELPDQPLQCTSAGLTQNAQVERSTYEESIQVRDGDLFSVLDQIANERNGLEWHVVDEVINVYPTKQKSDLLDRILALNLQTTSIEFGNGSMSVGYSLFSLDSFRDDLSAFGVSSMLRPDGNTKIRDRWRLSASGQTTRNFLNTAVKESDFVFWTAYLGVCDNERQVKMLFILMN